MSRTIVFGEILLRYSPPGRELLLQTPRLQAFVGGAEANVATALAVLGHEVGIASALPPGPLGDAALAGLRGRGVDCAQVLRRPGRMGIYYVVTGAGRRASEVLYDRAGSAFAMADPDAWDWPAILAGAGRLHLSGITPALGPIGAQAARAAVRAAAAAGVPISFDGNYRARLWETWDGDPRAILHDLVREADILFGNHRDIALLLARDFAGTGTARRRAAAEAAFAAYPKLRLIASTARTVEHSAQHRLAGRIDARDQAAETPELLVADIVDRVGGGDAFAAGVLHGLMQARGLEHAVRQGVGLALLKHSLPGDAALFDQDAIDAAMGEEALDVRR